MTHYTLFVRLTLIATWMLYNNRLVQGDNLPGWTPTSGKGQINPKGATLNPHSNIQERGHRVPRGISPNCNSWFPWLNDNHPSATNKNDHERVTSQQIATYCPVHLGATATKVQCKDDKGEPFTGPIRDPNNNYAGNCTDVKTGVLCEMFDQNSNDQCPDFSFSFYCNCTEASSIGQQGTYPSSTVTMSSSTGSISPTSMSAKHTQVSTPTMLAASTMKSTVRPHTYSPNTLTTSSSMGSIGSTARSATRTTASAPTTLAVSTMASAGESNTDKQIYCEEESKHELFENNLLLFILCVVGILLCIFNFGLVLALHKRAMTHAKTKWQSQVKPLRLV